MTARNETTGGPTDPRPSPLFYSGSPDTKAARRGVEDSYVISLITQEHNCTIKTKIKQTRGLKK